MPGGAPEEPGVGKGTLLASPQSIRKTWTPWTQCDERVLSFHPTAPAWAQPRPLPSLTPPPLPRPGIRCLIILEASPRPQPLCSSSTDHCIPGWPPQPPHWRPCPVFPHVASRTVLPACKSGLASRLVEHPPLVPYHPQENTWRPLNIAKGFL